IKPTNASGGKGVIANIKNEKDFIESLYFIRDELGYQKVMVEEFVDGQDYRLYVIGNKVAGVFSRIPANIIGDGVNTINHLLNLKKRERAKNPGINKQTIVIDKETINLLKSQGYNMRSIPKQGETIYLKTTSNISSGGDSVDYTNEIPSEVKHEAIKAVKAI